MFRTNHARSNRARLLVGMLSIVTSLSSLGHADENVLAELEEAAAELANETYVLQYKYQPGEVISYELEQLVTMDMTVSGTNQKTKLRTRSTRSFRLQDITPEGHFRFVHTVDHVNMWNEISGRETVKYDSRVDDQPPPECETFASNIGKPISIITMDQHGMIVHREDKVQQPELGLGGLSIPLPEGEVKPGHQWTAPLELKVQLEDKRIKSIKTRELYTLEKVETGVATISVKTQILTPVTDARVKFQIMQRISEGEIRFDVDHGRLLSKTLNWDEQVLGFNGAESNMKYLARFTESLVDTQQTAAGEPAAQTR